MGTIGQVHLLCNKFSCVQFLQGEVMDRLRFRWWYTTKKCQVTGTSAEVHRINPLQRRKVLTQLHSATQKMRGYRYMLTACTTKSTSQRRLLCSGFSCFCLISFVCVVWTPASHADTVHVQFCPPVFLTLSLASLLACQDSVSWLSCPNVSFYILSLAFYFTHALFLSFISWNRLQSVKIFATHMPPCMSVSYAKAYTLLQTETTDSVVYQINFCKSQ